MAFPKTHLFDDAAQHLSRFSRALGHPARISILELLHNVGSLHVLELEQLIPLSQGTITEHLRRLRVAGLIDVEEQGLMNFYTINPAGLQELFNGYWRFAETFSSIVCLPEKTKAV